VGQAFADGFDEGFFACLAVEEGFFFLCLW
jgi:hypothetical protein